MSDQKVKVPFNRACDFVIQLGEAAHGYGSSSARLEAFLSSLMASFGYLGTVLSTPNGIVFGFQESESQPQRFHLITSLTTGLDLNKLALVGDLVTDVINGETNIEEAVLKLREIKKTSAPWGKMASAISFMATGAGIAGVLMGSWYDIAVAVPLSFLVYIMVIISSGFKTTGADWLPLIASFIIGILTAFTKVVIPELNIVLVGVSAIAILLPGFTISTGAMELVGGNVVSGIINLVSGLVYLLKLVIGGWVGAKLVISLLSLSAQTGTAPDIAWQWLFVPVFAIGLCLSLQTSTRDFPWALAACLIAYLGSFLGSKVFESSVGTLLGTVILVVFSNKWTTKTGRPTSILLVPGILMLVSGFAGFQGFLSLAEGQIQQGENQIQHMFLVAITIGAGLVVGNTVSRPKVTL